MSKEPIRRTEYFAIRRLTALWLFACLLFLSAAAPFGHTCSVNQNDTHSTSISSGIACASCQWVTVERSTGLDAQVETPKPVETAVLFAPLAESAALQTLRVV